MVSRIRFYLIQLSQLSQVEGKSFVKEMLGSGKEQESLFGFFQASAEFLKMHLGSIDVRFILQFWRLNSILLQITISDKLISLQSYLSTAKYQLQEQNKLDRAKLVSALSHMILYEANLVATITVR